MLDEAVEVVEAVSRCDDGLGDSGGTGVRGNGGGVRAGGRSDGIGVGGSDGRAVGFGGNDGGGVGGGWSCDGVRVERVEGVHCRECLKVGLTARFRWIMHAGDKLYKA